MWIYANPNPDNKHVPDCVIRALSIALNRSWDDIYETLTRRGGIEHNMPSADVVWGRYLYDFGFQPFKLPNICPRCITIHQFTRMYPRGIYIIGTGNHAVAVIDGNYYDTWDSGDQYVSFFFRIE